MRDLYFLSVCVSIRWGRRQHAQRWSCASLDSFTGQLQCMRVRRLFQRMVRVSCERGAVAWIERPFSSIRQRWCEQKLSRCFCDCLLFFFFDPSSLWQCTFFFSFFFFRALICFFFYIYRRSSLVTLVTCAVWDQHLAFQVFFFSSSRTLSTTVRCQWKKEGITSEKRRRWLTLNMFTFFLFFSSV